MRVLLDTNIIISREDNKAVPEVVQRLLVNLSDNRAEVKVHPLSDSDLANDRNEERRIVVTSKLKSYSMLMPYPDFINDIDFKQAIGWRGDRKKLVDMQLLYAVYKNSVDILITRDLEIHKYATKLGIDDRVLDVEEASSSFPPKQGWTSHSIPLQEIPLWKIDLNDIIFDDLKTDYPGFIDWWGRKSREGRTAIINQIEDGHLGAILILKEENEAVPCLPPLPARPRIKISSFRVTNNGHYLGEFFIKLSIEKALSEDCQEIYFTHFTKSDDSLISLVKKFGFDYYGKMKDKYQKDEDIYLKRIFPDGRPDNPEPSEIDRRYFPSYYDGKSMKKAIVPIIPQYHEQLFGLIDRQQSTLDKLTGGFIPEQNTIRKAYVSRSRTRLSEGDVLLFYRSRDLKAITSIGVVESSYYNINDPSKIIKLVSRRTVYSHEDIEKFAKNGATVILFKHCFALEKPISSLEMDEDFGIKVPQTISIIDDEKYRRLIQRGGIDRRFTIH